jgi:hypothetical protein
MDYANLQYYSKIPTENQKRDKNIVHIQGDKAKLYIDAFKTRWKTAKNGDKKEVLPRYVKELSPKMKELLKDYIKKWNITDMSKVKDGKQHYVFFKETGASTDKYDENGFSKYITSCMKQMFRNTGLSVNTLRHVFQDWIDRNITSYNELQLQEIATDVGDKWVTTMFKYRKAPIENIDKPITQIDQEIYDRDDALKNMVNALKGDDEASVGQGVSHEEVDEFNSPVRVNEPSAMSKEQMVK